jgi:crotonobetainyl-CoA:carnitine CoA-transferase CaiB-like acyl-CoA transferase
VPRAKGEKLRVVGQPISLSRTPSKIAVAPPALGEHTDEVLAEFGFKPDEIASYRSAKVI